MYDYGNEKKVTSLDVLKGYAAGSIVELPPFAEGQPFVVRMKRPSMLALAKLGKIPNTLLTKAGELFAKGGNALNADDSDMLEDLFKIIDVMCEAALVEPRYKELKEANIELTDEQYMAIFNYCQAGVSALENFR